MSRQLLCAASIAVAVSTPAPANDSVADVGVGGLVLARTADVEMAREDLYISTDQIKVDYVFRNTSDSNVDSVVAFPLPDIAFDPEMNTPLPSSASDNFLGFEVAVDGKTVTPQLDQRAFSVNVDVTDLLNKNGIPLYGYAEGIEEKLKALPDDVLADFVERGILSIHSWTDGITGEFHSNRNPNWVLRSAYWWKSSFPAGKDVRVSHRYKPAVGGSSSVGFFSEGKFTDWSGDMRKEYCIDASMEASLKKSMTADGYAPYVENYVDYVLMTGGNWATGRIGEFHLTIDKGDAENLVSFCGKGVKKTGPTTFEMAAKDFAPEEDISVLFLTPRSE